MKMTTIEDDLPVTLPAGIQPHSWWDGGIRHGDLERLDTQRVHLREV